MLAHILKNILKADMEFSRTIIGISPVSGSAPQWIEG